MKKPYKKIFRDELKLKELLNDWANGEGLNIYQLAQKNACDRTTIYYHLKQHGFYFGIGKDLVTLKPKTKKTKLVGKYDYLMEEELNKGYNYKTYLAHS